MQKIQPEDKPYGMWKRRRQERGKKKDYLEFFKQNQRHIEQLHFN